jgi:hypothetical protein
LKIFRNLLKTIAPSKLIVRDKGILQWGDKNSYPQNLLTIVYDSHTASASLDTYIDFLEGAGIAQKEIADIKVNQNETLNDLHAKESSDMGYMDGVSILVKYNALGEKVELHHLPFESCRLGIPDDTGWVSTIHYNPLYGTNDYKNDSTHIYDVYNPKVEVVLSQIARDGEKYKGQVYWFAFEKPLKRFYPEVFYSAGLKWFLIDKKIGQFHERNLDNNFLLSVLMKVIGDPDEAAETDSEGRVTKTVGQSYDELMSNSFSGSENGGMAMVLWAKAKDQFPELQQFPTSTNHELFITLQKLTIDNIAIATKVPPILANIQTSSGFNTDEIVNSIKLMYQRVRKKQAKLERIYKELLTGFNGVPELGELKIRNINPIDVVPDNVWAALTLEEQRIFIEKNFDIELKETLPTNPEPNVL